ncbi:hypothetical protein AnigIFM60653_000418 [Aspergillus niger]|uniref:Uncharacterized protein n=3 Tax=Aspergillus niger TaxID=5061 RepID=A2QI78_ASPNC|nr:hypothetical protein An04g02560 [Aspergillus niger]RDH20907.1 hypothetical protein M747DRAFT_304887 [Aspergillus niger ATCC 13496]CAL00743.1 hypothetical protein An04g02560 [Aspergillus niger]GJP87692.1 RNase H family protein [Aspergillus niger]GKZ58219.1 hypothetical protein AnigIFM49718_004034 [Aspergillus niger]GKZ64708.1 hypothetical protein AnigIFM50267_005779 [Aspergillus niger]
MRSSLGLLASVSRSQPSKLRKPTISLDHKYPARPPRMNCTDMLVGSLSAIETLQTWYAFLGILVQYQTDEYGQQHIRYLISTGKSEFDMMRRYIDEQVAG